MLRVYSLEELFDAAETLSHYAAAGGEDAGEARLAMVTNGGGLGVLATDALVDEGGKLAELARSEEHTSELQSLMRLSYAVFCLTKKTPLTSQVTRNHNRYKHNSIYTDSTYFGASLGHS